MKKLFDPLFSPEKLVEWRFALFDLLRDPGGADCRQTVFDYASRMQQGFSPDILGEDCYSMVRDCARALRGMCTERAEELSGFSVAEALCDIARGRPRADLSPAFCADVAHILAGIERPYRIEPVAKPDSTPGLAGRAASVARSSELDFIWRWASGWMERYPDGLAGEAVAIRGRNRRRILGLLGGSARDWRNWEWHTARLITTPETFAAVCEPSVEELEAVRAACSAGVPFGVTPYYASLMSGSLPGGDASIRAQVIPGPEFVEAVARGRSSVESRADFMLERETSPIDLVTRRYPAIVILKPFNTCPQICAYCQRNWEIDGPMSPGAMASRKRIENALEWIRAHDAIREVLVTGGDPLAMEDREIEWLLGRLAAIPHVELVRIGTRIPVTLPMRITPGLVSILSRFRRPGVRELLLVTHVQHPSEVTPEMVRAVARICSRGISVYNQMVFTFFVSRRFEAARLRMLLRRIGVDPYYTFVPKGKEETAAFRVPLARILQEQKEEARLLPGSRRTDSPVFNVPGLGKSYLRGAQHRDLLSIMPDGSRVYEFHPWERNISRQKSWVGGDVPILGYLERLAAIGEDPADYSSIWYYF
ncbi:KamA family radical SAM protein [Candidatus Fermentibacteria bacterium]|nr:KamA family radical SAM protein [Candidatus Fermentibacteria bacterium]